MEATIPFNNHNRGGKMLIAMRALPGTVSKVTMRAGIVAGEIGVDEYDSIVSGVTYVIRRPCQTLPCFLIHF
jgi:hypothetical protein